MKTQSKHRLRSKAQPKRIRIIGQSVPCSSAKQPYCLADGRTLVIHPLDRTANLSQLTLREVATLVAHGDSAWLLNGSLLTARGLWNEEGLSNSEFQTRWDLLESIESQEFKPARRKIAAVAWFEEWHSEAYDTAGGLVCVYVPVILSGFDLSARAATNTASFENDYRIVFIPPSTKLAIRSELRDVIKKIAANGGALPRTQLAEEAMGEKRPERLLNSTTGKAITKAKLLWVDKTNPRAVVFRMKLPQAVS